MYICERSRSFGAGSATTRKTRGLTRSVSRLMTPPFPAVSRPSNTMHTLACSWTTQRCSCTSSTCRRSELLLVFLASQFAGWPGSALPHQTLLDLLEAAVTIPVRRETWEAAPPTVTPEKTIQWRPVQFISASPGRVEFDRSVVLTGPTARGGSTLHVDKIPVC